MKLHGKRLLLGVTGGIAAYKAANLLRLLQKSGAEVRVIMTPSALRFIGKETFVALSRCEVPIEVFNEGDASSWTRHIHWGEWADLLVIAPCTANTLAKLVHGFSDNMLTTTVLAARCPILICPAMDGGMYSAPATQHNLKKAREFGFHVMEPESGYLASGLHDVGRLPDESAILTEIHRILSPIPQLLAGKKVVVTAGPTREHLDPVRFISNPSSGKMGLAMAEAARALGAEVTFIHGPLSVPVPAYFKTEPILSAAELFEAVKAHHHADIIIMAAAVSDFTPRTTAPHKVKKSATDTTIELTSTVDILKWLGENRVDHQLLIGFAMETENLLHHAREKLTRKKVDVILANSLHEAGSGFGSDTNVLHGISAHSEKVFSGTKTTIAREALQWCIEG